MIVRTSIVLVVTGTLFTLVGLFAPAANLGAAATPVSLYQVVGGLLDWKVGAPALPPALAAMEMRLLGGCGVLLVAAFLAIGFAVFKFLKASLVPCVAMTCAAGFLMFTMAGLRDVSVVVPHSYGWILLIAGSLVASVTAFFTLFGPGPDEAARRKTMTEAPKVRSFFPAEPEPEPPPPPPKPPEPPKPAPPKAKASPRPGEPRVPLPKRDEPQHQRLSAVLKGDRRKDEAAKAEAPGPKPGAPDAAKPAASTPAGDGAGRAGAGDAAPDTLAPMPASGYSGEEPTESGGWVLSGFDANGMAVRLNISDVELRSAEDGVVIGRNVKQSRLVLNDDSVSRRHARLSGSNPLTIEDLDSANGTVVNRELLIPGQKVPIEPGVAIEIGAVRLTLVRS